MSSGLALIRLLKGQMNQKIETFSFVALPSPNTKKKLPKWDLGEDFSSQAFIERLKFKIRAFPKTSRKRFWNGRVIDWRLLDVNVGLSGRKKSSAQASAHPLSPAFVCLVLWEFWLRLNEIHEVRTFAPCKGFFLFLILLLFIRHLKITKRNRRQWLCQILGGKQGALLSRWQWWTSQHTSQD